MTAQPHYDVLIVGTGHAGAQAAIALRQRQFPGTIGLVGDEQDPPYERPPLSKDYLAGDKPFDRILLRPRTFWPDRGIDLLPGRRVVGVDAARRCVTLADGAALGFGALIWAGGGTARRLKCPGSDGSGVHSIRTRADVDRLSDDLRRAERVVVVGGGYIGLEAAAVLTMRGKSVTIVEAQQRVLSRVAAAPLAHFYEREHRAHGVDFRMGAVVDRLAGRDGRVNGVVLADGETLGCDLVIAGIGITPAIETLRSAGARIGDGVIVDAQCRTSLADIYAIGDCAAHPNPYFEGDLVRLESVQNATDQASLVADVIMGRDAQYCAVPWFWSNQYDLKLQTIGLSAGHDEIVVRGEIDRRSFSLVYLRQGRVIALDCVNAARDFVQGRALVIGGEQVAPARLRDAGLPLNRALAATGAA